MKSLLFLIASIFAVPSVLAPLPSDQLEVLNTFIQTILLPLINEKVDEKIEDNKMDPWAEVISGGAVKILNLPFCNNATAGTSYGVHNLKGLEAATLSKFVVVAADVSEDDTHTVFDLVGTIAPANLTADVHGHYGVVCKNFKPRVGLSGLVSAHNLEFVVTGRAHVTTDPTFVVNTVTLDSVTADFQDIMVALDGKIDRIFNPLLEKLLPAIENTFKSLITKWINQQFKGRVQTLVDSKLPYSFTKIHAPSAISAEQ